MNVSHEGGHSKPNINANTGISIGIVVIILGGFAWVIKGQSDNRNETVMSKMELTSQIKELGNRVNSLESAKNSWTATDMFKWAVHLQQSNPSIKVPEPEVDTKK